MAIPTATEARNHLEGYQVNSSILSDGWIEDERDGNVVPYVESYTKRSISDETEQEVTEFYSGVGTSILILNRRPVNELVNLELVRGDELGPISVQSHEPIGSQGLLKAKTNLSEGIFFSIFPKGEKNIKVTYKYSGALPADLKMAIKKLMCVKMLQNISSRTGGGSLSTQGFSRNYGDRGKYTNAMNELSRDAHAIMNRYKSAVVGS